MSKRWVFALVAVLIVGGGALGVWYQFFRGNAPEAVSLDAIADKLGTPGAGSSGGLDGTWTVQQVAETFVGYRVKEELAAIGANTAVGRTPAVTGSVVIAGGKAQSAELTADMTKLKSDRDKRDTSLRTMAVETDTFKTSTFKLTQPVALPPSAASGERFTAVLKGDLTLHGVTKAVEIPVEGQLLTDALVVVGSLPVVFADYAIKPPQATIVLGVEDHGVMELQVVFKR